MSKRLEDEIIDVLKKTERPMSIYDISAELERERREEHGLFWFFIKPTPWMWGLYPFLAKLEMDRRIVCGVDHHYRLPE